MNSIVIPIYGLKNKLETVFNLLFSIERYGSNANIGEVVIVNNGGMNIDDTKKYLLGLSSSKIKIIIVDELTSGLNNARNIGLRVARGDIVIFLDDDVLLLDTSISSLVSRFNNPDVNVVGAKINLVFDHKIDSWLNSEYYLRFLAPQRFPKSFSIITQPFFIFGGAMAVRRGIVISKFDLNLDRNKGNLLSGGDTDITLLFQDSSYIDPNSEVYTIVKRERYSFYFFIKRFYWQGVTDSVLYSKHKVRLYDHDELFITKKFIKNYIQSLLKFDIRRVICNHARVIGFWIKNILIYTDIYARINRKKL
ncbi:MAG: glycosyltransferase [Patescibacteria group bacterium]